MDKFDVAILNSMQYDDTLSVGQVAEKIGLSKTACWRRIQKLVADNVISDRVAILNPASVNLPLTVFISIRTNQHNDEWTNEFRRVIAQIPQILEVYQMTGDLDYLLKAVVKDMPGYEALYKNLIKANIFDVNSSFVMDELKRQTQLPLDNINI